MKPASPTLPTSSDIRGAVMASVSSLMERAGNNAAVSAGSDVIRGLGLTSEDGVELACMLEASLKIRIPHDANPLIHDSNGQRAPRTIQQVCDAVAAWAQSGGAA